MVLPCYIASTFLEELALLNPLSLRLLEGRVYRSFLDCGFILALFILLGGILCRSDLRNAFDVADPLNFVRHDGPANRVDFTLLMLFECEGVDDESVLVDQLVGLAADADLASDTAALHLVCNEDVLTEDVITDNLGSDDASYDFARVDPNAHVEVLQDRVLGPGSLIVDDIDHVEANLGDTESFLDLNDR